MIIGSYANSIGSLNNMIRNTRDLNKAFERLSSGQRINSAADDPAGLVISVHLRAQIAAISKQIDNLEYQNNKYSTADGYLASMTTNLLEMRDVALAASDDGATTPEMRASYQNILNINVESYNRNIENSSYGTQELLDGSTGSVADIKSLENIDITSSESARLAVETIDSKIDEILNLRGDIGAQQKYEFQSQRENLRIEMQNLIGSESSITDTDMAWQYMEMIKSNVSRRAAIYVHAVQGRMNESLMKILSRW